MRRSQYSFENARSARSLPPRRYFGRRDRTSGHGDPGFVKLGATVIDVGINPVTERTEFDHLFAGNAKRWRLFRQRIDLVGDVHPEVAEVAGAITPVPGGVGR